VVVGVWCWSWRGCDQLRVRVKYEAPSYLLELLLELFGSSERLSPTSGPGVDVAIVLADSMRN